MKALSHSILLFLTLLFACKDDEIKSDLAELESFSIKELPELNFEIFDDNRVEATASDGTSLNSLTAIFEISEGASIFVGAQYQGSGSTKQDFSNTVTYRVEAEDGTEEEYPVTIFTDLKIRSFSIVELPDITFNIMDESISATVPFGTNLNNLTAKYSIAEGATLYVNNIEQVSEETTNNFTQSLTYVLKSEGNPKKQYSVIITIAENMAPIANAGDDKKYYIPSGSANVNVVLDASLSQDTEGNIVSYLWEENNTELAIGISADVELEEGIHNISLVVTDSEGLTSTDEVVITIVQSGNYIAVDDNVNAATQNLLSNLGQIANGEQFIFGQEFPLSFKLSGLSYDLTTSDCKDVAGDHPGVYGIDPHYMLYKSDTEKQLHINEAKEAYQNGAVVTFDFHQQSRTDHKIYMSEITSTTDKSLMYDIVNDNNGARSWFYSELDEIIDIINNDLGFPIVWRLYHEMGGGWFWWGSEATYHSTNLYISFYQLAVNYIKERTDLVLFAWSPNYPLDESYYPGDDYVDIIGVDIYEPTISTLKSSLINLSDFALNHNKIAVLAETGYRNDYINTKEGFWNDIVLDAIKQGGEDIRIAWALAWFNAPWASEQSDLFIPNSDSPQNAKYKFIEFKNDPITLFQEDVEDLKVYE